MLVHFLEDANWHDLNDVYVIEDTSNLKDTIIRLRKSLSMLEADFIGVEVDTQVYSLNSPVRTVLGEEDYERWLDCHLDDVLLDIEDEFLDAARADCHLVVGRTYARIDVVLKHGERLELEFWT